MVQRILGPGLCDSGLGVAAHCPGAGWLPALNTVPLITIRPLKRPMGEPFLMGMTSRVTSSPVLNVVLLHPAAFCVTVLCASITQCDVLPLSSLASTFRKTCGLAQVYSVTVPFNVIVFFVSYDAFPWWANSGTDTAVNTPAAREM